MLRKVGGEVEAYPDVAGVVAAASAFVRFRPGLCTLRVAGRSREGRPLYVLTVGRDRPGVRNVLVVAGGLADRRGGGAAALRVAERVALDPALHLGPGAAWHFLLCLDPDGAARTEAGPAVRRTLAEHFLHAFRRPPAEEPEHAGRTPESAALAALIDELRPVLQCSLRGVEAGGARVLTTREVPGLAADVATVCAERRVPLRLGAYGLPYGVPTAPGVVQAVPSDADASAWWRTPLTAVVEVPMWSTPGAAASHEPSADLAARLAALRGTPASHLPDAAEALLAAHPSAWLPVPTQLDTHAALTLAIAARVLS